MLQHWLTPISISGTTHFIEHHFRDKITSQIQNKIPLTPPKHSQNINWYQPHPCHRKTRPHCPHPSSYHNCKTNVRVPPSWIRPVHQQHHLIVQWSRKLIFFFEARQLLFKTYIIITVVLQIDIAMRSAVLRDWKVQCLEHVHVRDPHREATSSPRTCTWSAVKWLNSFDG